MSESRLSEEDQAKIRDFYQHGKGSIQDYARIYRVDVNEILHIIGEDHLATVHIEGDQVDESELGPTGKGQISLGEDVAVTFTTH